MAKIVKLENLGRLVKENVEVKTALEYKATAFEMFSQIIQKTPVETGRARGNWNITTDSPDYSTSESGKSPNVEVEVDNDFPDIYIANGLDYVVELEDGKSGQAPTGIIIPAIAAARANRRR